MNKILYKFQALHNIFLGNPGKSAILLHHFAHKYHKGNKFQRGLSALFYRLNIALNGCDIHPDTVVGSNFSLPHPIGVVMGICNIGDNVSILQNVSLGNNFGFDSGWPIIGNSVLICAGAVVFGSIKIGNNVRIGANAVVMTDLPDNCTAVGNPARIIQR